MKNIRKLLVLIILIMASVVSLSACGDPYAKMKLTVDDGGFENALERRFEYAGAGNDQNKFEISVTVTGAGKGVGTGVVFTIEDKGLIEEVGDSVEDGAITTQTFRLKDTGETYITVATKEGGLRERIKITSFSNATGLAFIETTNKQIPMLKGQTTDVSRVMPGFSKALLTFTPSYATERDVELSANDSNIVIDGNSVTVPSDFQAKEFRLTATLKNDNTKTVTATVAVLDPIDMDKISLKYVSAYEQRNYNSEDPNSVKPIQYDLEKSSEYGDDYILPLADQQAGDVIRDARNIFIASVKNSGITIANYTFKLTENKGTHTKILADGNYYSISNGDGVGNSDKYYFNINYKDYENIFTGVTICVKVNVDTFPTDVVINTNANVAEVEQKENKIFVFNNYSGMPGTVVYPKLRNKGGFISGQTLYVGIWDLEAKVDAPNGGFTILDSKGNTVIPKLTKVKSGEALYIRFDSAVLTNADNYEGRYVLYAYSSMDISISSLATKAGTGSATVSEYNNLVLIKDFTLETGDKDTTLTDVTIELNSGDETIKLNINTANNKIPYELFDVKVGAIAKVDLHTGNADEKDNGYYVKAKDGANSIGQTYYTVVAPNGFTITKNLFITKAYNEYTNFALKVGSLTIASDAKSSITIDIQKTLTVSLLIDGVEFTALPPRYSMSLTKEGGNACTYEGWQRINSLSTPTQGNVPDKFTFKLNYSGTDGPKSVGTFELNITVVKPIKRITASNSYVEILSNSITPLKTQAVDSKITNTDTGEGGYLDISSKSKKTLYYTLNPLDASIGIMTFDDGTNSVVLPDLSLAEFSFVYDGDVTMLLTQTYSESTGGSYVEYNGDRYYFKIETENGAQKIVWYKLSDNSPVADTTMGYELCNTPITFEYTYSNNNGAKKISFKWLAGIANNKITLQLTDVKDTANGEVRFGIRLDYRQKYTVDPVQTYKVNYDEVTGDYYLTLSKVRVNYVGSYRIEQSMFVKDASGSVTGIRIGGIVYPVNVTSFTYDKYYITVSTSTTFKITNPVLTEKLTLVGQKDSNAVGKNATEGSVYTINLNSNQLTTDSTFGYTYLTSPLPAMLEKPGVIVVGNDGSLTEEIEGASKAISTLKYDGDKVVGAVSGSEWAFKTGFSFEIDYLTNQIKFKINNVSTFTANFTNAGKPQSKILRIITLDSALASNENRKYVTLVINLKTGTAENPYIIYDADSLQKVNLDLDAHYRITNDISLQGANNWTPIGVSDRYQFTGTISTEGNKKFSIYGFHGTVTPAVVGGVVTNTFQFIGIFGYIGSGAKIQNITFKDIKLNVRLDNAYTAESLYIGTVAGYIGRGAELKNVSLVDTENLNYASFPTLKNFVAMDFNNGITINNSGNIHTEQLTVYVGGFAGQMQTGFTIDASSFTINIRDDQSKHTYYVGGVVGNMSSTVTGKTSGGSVSQIYTIIKTNNPNASSAFGGVVGLLSGIVKNMDVTTYMYATDGVNLGGVVGKITSGAVSDVSSLPMIYGAGESSRIGGVAGSVDGLNTNANITRVKVKFSDRRCENAMFNSSLTGSNFVGGIVGSAIHDSLTIKECSVFSYVTKRDEGFLGDIVVLKNGRTHYVGGFIGGNDNITSSTPSTTLTVESSYLNADIRTFDGARIGGVIGSMYVKNYTFRDVTLTGNIYYVGNYITPIANETDSVVGNFIGKLIPPSTRNDFMIASDLIGYYTYSEDEKDKDDSTKINKDKFNIIDSYSILKAVDTTVEGAELDYIKNFAGDGETEAFKTGDRDYTDVEYARLYLLKSPTGSSYDLRLSVLGSKAESVSGDGKIQLTKTTDTISFTLTLPSCFSIQASDSNITNEENAFKFTASTSSFSDSISSASYLSLKVQANTTFNRVRVLNSFYMGYKTNLHFEGASKSDVQAEYTFNEADFIKSISQVDKDNLEPVEVDIAGTTYKFNYFNNYGYNNFTQPVFTLKNNEISNMNNFLYAGKILEFNVANDTENNIYKFQSSVDPTGEMYFANGVHSLKNEKTYIFYGEDGGALNDGTLSLDDFTKYQNKGLLDGNAISLISNSKINNNNKPNLVVDIAPEKMTVEVQNTYSAGIDKPVAILEIKNTEEDVNASNAYLISDIVSVKVEPALASTEAYFTSSDDSVFVVTGEYIVLKGEGVAVLRATSRLNQDCYAEISIMAISIDRDNMAWSIKDANSTKEYNEIDNNGNLLIDIIANNGTTLTTVINSKATLTFGVNYVVDLNSVTTQQNTLDQKVEFLQTLTIGGKKIDSETINKFKNGELNTAEELKYTITCSGLQHAVFNSVLGSVNVEQQIYFMYEIGGTTYNCFVSSSTGEQGKKLKMQFREGVFGISGSNELSFVVINRENFLIALNCDSAEFELSLTATLNGEDQVINTFTEGDEIRLSDYGLGYLSIRLESVTFEAGKKLKTFRFSAYVDDDGQQAVNADLVYNLQFVPRLNSFIYADEELSHDVSITISQQQVESLNITHYTNMLDISYPNDEPDAESASAYKYQSDTVIPGYTSLMQIDFYPSFGYFDYVEVTTLNSVTLSQVVEALHYGNKSTDYSWYESYSERVEMITGGIRINNRYSVKDYDLTDSLRYMYNGSLYVAISADTTLSDTSIEISIKGYRRGVTEALFDHAINLKVEARPDITVSASDSEITFGGKVSLNINVQYSTEAFTASLKAEGTDTELLGSLADVNYDVALASYVLTVRDNGYVYSTYSEYMYKQLVLTLGISKVINGTRVTSTKSTSVRLVPYIVEGIVLNLNGASLDGRNYLVSYYQAYSVSINAECSYSQGYYNYLLSTDPSGSIAVQIAQFENLIAKNIATFGMLSQGVAGSRNTLLSKTVHEYNGEFALIFDPTRNSTTIRFISSSVSNFIWAELGLQYTAQGIELMPLVYSPKYAFSYYVSVTVDTASADDHPEPITSVNDLLNMREGVSYILLKDLYLANWSPLDANFDVFDGNGYVLTILSFANIDSDGETTNVGIFKSIGEGSIVKNLTIEVMPYNGYSFSSEEYSEGTFAGNISNKIKNTSNDELNNMLNNGINVDVSKLENVNFGLLAGENQGLITNVKVVNDATSYRSAREKALNNISDSLKVNINYGDNISSAIEKFATLNKDNRKVKVNTLVEDEAKSKNDYIGGLVGQNSGFITNSSVSNISIESQEYIGGLVGYNLASAKISSSYFKESDITHTGVVKANSGAGGLVARNAGLISYSYVEGVPTNTSDTTNYPVSSNLRAQGSQISTYSYAGGFAYENVGTISNCYANIVLAGSSAGFVYLNQTATSVVEYCYSLSSIRLKDDNYYPFTRKLQNGLGTVKDCFYLYDVQFANMDRDAGVSLEKNNFNDYNAFVGYAFNSDYTINASVLNAVWYIPNGENSHLVASEFNVSQRPAPQLVDANVVTLSVRYMIQGKTDEYAFTYNYATPLGTVTNPILIDTAEAYNKSIQDQNETRYYRFISDISFTRGDEVGTTINTNFKGKLDGNSMTIKNLRLSSDGINTNDSVTRLGLFATIEGKTVNGVQDYAVVKNLNIEVAQINGMNVNMVGVLAGEVKDASIYNVSVKGADGVIVQGLNAVGGIAGVVSGDTDLVNLSSSISVASNYLNDLNPFDYTMPATFKAQGASNGDFDKYVKKTTLYVYDDDNIKRVSYAGGIAGICNIMKRNPDEVEDDDLSNLYANLYRARRLYLTGTPEISGEVVGGIFGFLSENSNMSDCDITVSNGMHLKSTRVAGGLVGHSLGEIKRCTIQNSNQESLDNIIKTNYSKYDNAKTDLDLGVEDLFGGSDTEYRAMFVGGLVGVMEYGTILNSYSRVTVASLNSLYAGGVVGLAFAGTSLNSVYTTGSVMSYSAFGGIFGYVTDEISEENDVFFNLSGNKKVGNNSITNIDLTNVVGANIWKNSHINTTRKSTLSPNQPEAKIGALAGRIVKNVADNREQEVISAELAKTIFFHSTKLYDRAKSENVYFKQTYTYKSLDATIKSVIPEIGNVNPDKLLIFTSSELNLDNMYGENAEHVKAYKDDKGTIDTAWSPYFFTGFNNGKYYYGYISALFRYETSGVSSDGEASKIYMVSRAGTFGALRSLEEIIKRQNSVEIADKFYKEIGVTTNTESALRSSANSAYYKYENEDRNGNITTSYEKISKVCSIPVYMNTWDDKIWKGINVNVDLGTLEDPDQVFPALKNSLDTWTAVYVYKAEDLNLLNNRPTSTFILMNDIYLNENTGAFCSVRPFKGVIRSAKIGDVDGNNEVKHNFTFTIFNLNTTTSVSSSDDATAAGGLICSAFGATFENFNLHVVSLKMQAETAKNNKNVAMGVLLGKAVSSVTIRNVQILGGNAVVTPTNKIDKTSWHSRGGLDNDSFESNYIEYARAMNGYNDKEGNSLLTGRAQVVANNVDFMGGYVGVGSSYIYTGASGVKQSEASIVFTDEDYLGDEYEYKDQMISGLQKVGDKYYPATIVKDEDGNVVENEYVRKTQVKNITFTNNYTGTSYRDGAEQKQLSVVSYMGGYFGLVTINGNLNTNFRVSNCTFNFNLMITKNDENKFVYDTLYVKSGIYVGVIAGQIKNNGNECLVVKETNISKSSININTGWSGDAENTAIYDSSLNAIKLDMSAIYAGSIANLDQSIGFKKVHLQQITIVHNNGFTFVDGEDEIEYKGIYATTVNNTNMAPYEELIGGFAGNVTNAVEFYEETESESGSRIDIYLLDIKINGAETDVKASSLYTYVGGIAGKSTKAFPEDTYVSYLDLKFNSNNSEKSYIGGAFGYCCDEFEMVVKGDVEVKSDDLETPSFERKYYVGGFAGLGVSRIEKVKVAVYVTTKLSSKNSNYTAYIGGLAGGSDGQIVSSIVSGNLNIDQTNDIVGKNLYVAGLVGDPKSGKYLQDNMYVGAIKYYTKSGSGADQKTIFEKVTSNNGALVTGSKGANVKGNMYNGALVTKDYGATLDSQKTSSEIAKELIKRDATLSGTFKPWALEGLVNSANLEQKTSNKPAIDIFRGYFGGSSGRDAISFEMDITNIGTVENSNGIEAIANEDIVFKDLVIYGNGHMIAQGNVTFINCVVMDAVIGGRKTSDVKQIYLENTIIVDSTMLNYSVVFKESDSSQIYGCEMLSVSNENNPNNNTDKRPYDGSIYYSTITGVKYNYDNDGEIISYNILNDVIGNLHTNNLIYNSIMPSSKTDDVRSCIAKSVMRNVGSLDFANQRIIDNGKYKLCEELYNGSSTKVYDIDNSKGSIGVLLAKIVAGDSNAITLTAYTAIDNYLRPVGVLRDHWCDKEVGVEYTWSKNTMKAPRVDDQYRIYNEQQLAWVVNKVNATYNMSSTGAYTNIYELFNVLIDARPNAYRLVTTEGTDTIYTYRYQDAVGDWREYKVNITTGDILVDKELSSAPSTDGYTYLEGFNLSGKLFTPINIFQGTFDGGGVPLLGINIFQPEGDAGLFIELPYKAESVKKVYLKDGYIFGKGYVGGLTGSVTGNANSTVKIYKNIIGTSVVIFYKTDIKISKIAIENMSIASGTTSAGALIGTVANCRKVNLLNNREMIKLETSKLIFTTAPSNIYATVNMYDKTHKGDARLLVGTGYGATPRYGLIYGEQVTGYTNLYKNVYMAEVDFETKKITTKTCYLAFYAIEYSDYVFGKDGQTSGAAKHLTHAITSSNLSDYQGNKAIAKMPTFRFNYVDWKATTGANDVSNNFGLPRIIFDTQYWCDYTDPMSQSDSTDYDSTTETYLVKTPKELAWIALQVNTGNLEGAKVKLVNNIDLKGKVWVPIGRTVDSCKLSLFDGNGKTISNMVSLGYYGSRGSAYDGSFSGLFGLITDENSEDKFTISNFTIQDAYVEGLSSVGFVAGCASNSIIQNITIKNSKIAESSGSIGAIVGSANVCEIFNCGTYYERGRSVVSISANKGKPNIGGIVGEVGKYKSTKIIGCEFNGYISNSGSGYVGGLVGYMYMNTATTSHLLQSNKVSIYAFDTTYYNTGAIVGYVNATGSAKLYILETYIAVDKDSKMMNRSDAVLRCDLISNQYNLTASQVAIENLIVNTGVSFTGNVDNVKNYLLFKGEDENTSETSRVVKGYLWLGSDNRRDAGLSDVWAQESVEWNKHYLVEYTSFYGPTISDYLDAKEYSAPSGTYIRFCWANSLELGTNVKEVTITNGAEHNAVADYVGFRASNIRKFNIKYKANGTTNLGNINPIGRSSNYYYGASSPILSNNPDVGVLLEGALACSTSSFGGLFGYIQGVGIYGLDITYQGGDATITDSRKRLGGIANSAIDSVIMGCRVNIKNNITITNAEAVGGILGAGNYTSISRSTINYDENTFKVSSSSILYFGGIVGIMENAATYNYINYTSLEECFTYGGELVVDTYSGSETICVGGVVGYYVGKNLTSNPFRILKNGIVGTSINQGNSSYMDAVGGIVGKSAYALIAGNTVNMASTIKGAQKVGGIVGWADGQTIGFNRINNSTEISLVSGGKMSNTQSGNNMYGNVESCTTATEAGNDAVGGIVGYALGVVGIYRNLCGIEGRASYVNGKFDVGGIVGRMRDFEDPNTTLLPFEIAYNFNYATINKIDETNRNAVLSYISSQYVGGIVGRIDYTYANAAVNRVVSENANLANVNGQSYVGGLVGLSATNRITYQWNTVEGCTISGTEYVAGLVGRTGYAGTKYDRNLLGSKNAVLNIFGTTPYALTYCEYSNTITSDSSISSGSNYVNLYNPNKAATNSNPSNPYVNIKVNGKEVTGGTIISIGFKGEYIASDGSGSGFGLNASRAWYQYPGGDQRFVKHAYYEGKVFMFVSEMSDNSGNLNNAYHICEFADVSNRKMTTVDGVNVYSVKTTRNTNNLANLATGNPFYGYYWAIDPDGSYYAKNNHSIIVKPDGSVIVKYYDNNRNYIFRGTDWCPYESNRIEQTKVNGTYYEIYETRIWSCWLDSRQNQKIKLNIVFEKYSYQDFLGGGEEQYFEVIKNGSSVFSTKSSGDLQQSGAFQFASARSFDRIYKAGDASSFYVTQSGATIKYHNIKYKLATAMAGGIRYYYQVDASNVLTSSWLCVDCVYANRVAVYTNTGTSTSGQRFDGWTFDNKTVIEAIVGYSLTRGSYRIDIISNSKCMLNGQERDIVFVGQSWFYYQNIEDQYHMWWYNIYQISASSYIFQIGDSDDWYCSDDLSSLDLTNDMYETGKNKMTFVKTSEL